MEGAVLNMLHKNGGIEGIRLRTLLPDAYITMSKRLSKLIEEKNVSCREVADVVGITEVSMHRYLRGERMPQVPIMLNFANYFGVSVDYLYGLTDKKGAPEKITHQLKPCPFCGGTAHIMKMGYPHWVYCESCGAKVHGGVMGEEEGEAASIIAWNRRVIV